MPKNIPISFRVDHEDAAFLAQLEIPGATTPSEKIRGLIARARREHASRHTFSESTARTREALAPSLAAIEEAERTHEIHSDLVRLLLDWLPETQATFVTSLPAPPEQASEEELRRLERNVADRTISLLERVLRMGVTRACDAYEPEVLSTRLERILELADMIRGQARD